MRMCGMPQAKFLESTSRSSNLKLIDGKVTACMYLRKESILMRQEHKFERLILNLEMKILTSLHKVQCTAGRPNHSNDLGVVPLNEDCERTTAPLEPVERSMPLTKCVEKLIPGQLFSKDRHQSGRCGG